MAIIISLYCRNLPQFRHLPCIVKMPCRINAISCRAQNYKKLLTHTNISSKKGFKFYGSLI